MTRTSEDTLEQTALEWLKDLGYEIAALEDELYDYFFSHRSPQTRRDATLSSRLLQCRSLSTPTLHTSRTATVKPHTGPIPIHASRMSHTGGVPPPSTATPSPGPLPARLRNCYVQYL